MESSKSNGEDLEICHHCKYKAWDDVNLFHSHFPQINDFVQYRTSSEVIQSIPFELSRHIGCARIILELMIHPH